LSEAVAITGDPGVRHPALAHHFEGLPSRRRRPAWGMWLFLAQEVMFFGGLFAVLHDLPQPVPAAFAAGSAHLNWKLGAFNTASSSGAA
jgi:cytochrome c oxidase subunit 3